MPPSDEPRPTERWARLRFAIIGPLLAAPPPPGELAAALGELAAKTWTHPTTGQPLTFSRSTIERWYYAARAERRDPVTALERRIRRDAGDQPSLGVTVRAALRAQYRAHPSWTAQLHHDNLVALAGQDPALERIPSYTSIRRFLRAHGLARQRPRRHPETEGSQLARERFEHREVRSYEAEYVHGLWHLDFHSGRRKVLTREGAWITPRLLGILDDHSRLACHVQWYLDETAETLVHGLGQAIQKRGLPRALMTDNGAAMRAAEVERGLLTLGVLHQLTLPYSPHQNAKQEVFWASVEGRLMAMLEGVTELTLELLNEATQAWVEMEYNQAFHSEIGTSPLKRFLDDPHVGRESPSTEDLRRAFRAETTRRQRTSDGTVPFERRRFEVPSRFRHLVRVHVRYASWDLRTLDLVDGRNGKVLATLLPLDKTRNADGIRRVRGPVADGEVAIESAPPRDPIAPLLRQLMADYAATGLPPAYLPKLDATTNPNDESQEDG